MSSKKTNLAFYEERLNIIIEYIQANLDRKIDIKTLAEISHFSPFHFHRISRALLGEPIGAYISRMRVETAAKLLCFSKSSIEEIAYTVGFESPSSLSKKFKSHFGVSPSTYRTTKNHTIKKTTLMTRELNIKKPKILNLEDKNCLYYRMQGAYQTLDYAGAWEKLWAQIKAQKLFTKGIQMFGLPYDDPNVTPADKLRYDACLIIHKKAEAVGDIGVKTLKGGKFAVFLYQGSYKYFADVYNYMFEEWLINTDYELRDEPVRERYISHPDRVAENKLKTEFYIPIK
ncbi:GyrI-like domain-containing protein [uncultured Psychroserpens sp.]|uniref:AraC family transcriptional regulator n=1 Tax=uncultured Psychroserpens sp. TaxID=255436 RepID=UPI00260BBBCE|nr:AraC family transcriptional regulator [uncultured Psychroserpens sp.]